MLLNISDVRRAEVAIIGAGITGLSIAWHLARVGMRDIVVLERRGIGAEASGVQPGGVRQQWSTRISCQLAIESAAFYRDINRHLQTTAKPRLESCGYMFVADSIQEFERLERGVRLQNELGIPSVMIEGAEAEELVPGLLTDRMVGAAYCSEDGYFDKPQGVVEGFAEAVEREGVTLTLAEVVGLEPDDDAWLLRFANEGSLAARQIVVAAGYESPRILRSVGIELPIEKQARYLFLSDPIPERLLEPLVVAPGRRLAAKQLANGRVLASDLGATGDPQTNRHLWRENISVGIRSLLPRLEFVSFPTLVEGFYDVTPDHLPILGKPHGLPGLWIAAGFSGHGFMIAPAVGRRIADAVSGRGVDSAIAKLSLERFNGRRIEQELQVI